MGGVGLGIPGVSDERVAPSPSMEPSPQCGVMHAHTHTNGFHSAGLVWMSLWQRELIGTG